MATPIQFDLNLAFRNWRESLQQSPHFRAENLDELESHVRDSVSVLQSHGLTADEAFMIGIRRVGTAAALEDQFAAENGARGWRESWQRFHHKYANKVLHGVVLGYFTFGCWLLWGCLKVSQFILPLSARVDKISGVGPTGTPAFTLLFWDMMPFWYIPPVLAATYCGMVWTRKMDKRHSWLTFFSTLTGVLFLLLIPTLIASELPFINFLNRLPTTIWK